MPSVSRFGIAKRIAKAAAMTSARHVRFQRKTATRMSRGRKVKTNP